MFEQPDYVIVGAGSAGCVLAARLSEDPRVKILVLEAGANDRSPLIQIPLLVNQMYHKRLFDWDFSSEPEAGLNNRRIRAPRGKVLGGSSSINYMAYTRGDKEDYDGWERSGLSGWGWRHVVPYFKRAESWEGGETETRGGDGPIGVEYARDPDPLVEAWRAATMRQGVPRNDDPASGSIEGIGRGQYTIRNGRRSSTANAYLKLALQRPNLQLLTRTPVVRLLVENRIAQGVVACRDGTELEIRPTREVILCAGVYKTPQILMTAGIGRPADLAPLGVKCIADLPVGENLQEHWAVTTLHARPAPGVVHGHMRVDRMIGHLMAAYFFGRGPLTTIPSGLMGFARSTPGIPTPDIELMFIPLPPPLAYPWFPGVRRGYRDGFGINPAILHPFSRGSVSLASVDPQAAPKIRFNAFSDERDMVLMVRAVRLARAIAEDPALAPFRVEELYPGPSATSDGEIEAFIRESTTTVSHSCGTCAMGSDGVLDGELRLRNIDRLRVVDASAMPTIITGHTNACVIMMAERASDFIRSKGY